MKWQRVGINQRNIWTRREGLSFHPTKRWINLNGNLYSKQPIFIRCLNDRVNGFPMAVLIIWTARVGQLEKRTEGKYQHLDCGTRKNDVSTNDSKRTNKSSIEEIEPEMTLETKTMRQTEIFRTHNENQWHSDIVEKEIMLGKIEVPVGRERPHTRWTDGICGTDGIYYIM